MTEAGEGETTPRPPGRPRPAREITEFHTGIACGVAAICGPLAAVAVFKSDNELGTVALFAVAVFFTIIAIIGRVPKLKYGENEFDPTSYAIGRQATADEAVEVVRAAERVSEAAALESGAQLDGAPELEPTEAGEQREDDLRPARGPVAVPASEVLEDWRESVNRERDPGQILGYQPSDPPILWKPTRSMTPEEIDRLLNPPYRKMSAEEIYPYTEPTWRRRRRYGHEPVNYEILPNRAVQEAIDRMMAGPREKAASRQDSDTGATGAAPTAEGDTPEQDPSPQAREEE